MTKKNPKNRKLSTRTTLTQGRGLAVLGSLEFRYISTNGKTRAPKFDMLAEISTRVAGWKNCRNTPITTVSRIMNG